jgi:5-methylcytosine-specific restriction endonuclease McrA
VIKSRAEAKAAGEKHYFTGKPCRNHHIANRLVSCGACVACATARSATRQKYRAEHYLANREKTLASAASYYTLNRDKVLVSRANYYDANKDIVMSRIRVRRAKKAGNGGKHTPAEVKALLKLQGNMCVYCKKKLFARYHIDHVLPIKLGGGNDIKNIQILCSGCNLKKGARHPIKFAQSIGLLL